MEEIQKNNKPSFKGNYIKLAALLFVTLPGLVFMIVLLLGFDPVQYELARNPIFGYMEPVADPNNATGALLTYISALIFFIAISALLFMSMFIKSKKVLGLKMLAIGFVCFVLMACATIIPFSSHTFAFAQNLRGGEYNDNVAIFLQQDILSTQARSVILEDDIVLTINLPPQPQGQPSPQTPGPVTETITASEFAGILLHFVNIPLSEWGEPIRPPETSDAISEKIAQIANQRADARGLQATQRGAFIGPFSGQLEGRLRGRLVGMYPRNQDGSFIYDDVYATDEDGNYRYVVYRHDGYRDVVFWQRAYRYRIYRDGEYVFETDENVEDDKIRLIISVRRFNPAVRHGIEGAIESVVESAIATANYRFRHTMVFSVANMSLFGMMPLAIGGLILLKNKKASSEDENENLECNLEKSRS
ncbi:MAG: hypothetical protein FWE22_00030 [Firmicutes bacterium]|nr:hypothetical protein [Bacillota bacterium]